MFPQHESATGVVLVYNKLNKQSIIGWDGGPKIFVTRDTVAFSSSRTFTIETPVNDYTVFVLFNFSRRGSVGKARKLILFVIKSAQQINFKPYKNRLGVGAVPYCRGNKTGFCYMSGEDFRKNRVLLLRQ